jgi:hypothetical protein
VLTLVLALPAQAQNKKPGQKPGQQTLEAEKVFGPGNLAGQLLTLSGNLLTVRVDYTTLELKPNARQILGNASRQNQNLLNQLNRLAQLQNQLAGARSQKQYNSIMNQINRLAGQIQRTAGNGRGQQSPYRVVQKSVNVEIEMSPDVKIRTNFLPVAYDDMGELKKYTKEEIKELKGPNPKEPGYKAELDAVKVGQDIKVTLARVKEKDLDSPSDDKKDKPADKKDPAADKKDPAAEKKDPAAEKKDAAADKKTDAKDPADKETKKKPKTRLLATKILILKESDEPTSPGDKKRKKKQ